MLSYVLPTRNRPERLRHTLQTMHDLKEWDSAHEPIGGAEVIVIDNNSDKRPHIDAAIASRLRLRIIELKDNIGAASRNVGVDQAQSDWIVMLDDDSHPLHCNHIEILLQAPTDVAAIGAEILLPDGSHERGGLPEVIIGCGCAIRREAFEDAGGYDATFDYYAEEYDLCAKLILNGHRITHDFSGRFQILHEKTAIGRDFNAIVHRLVRNNAWVMQRYAPEEVRQREVAHVIERYAGVAMKEHAARGFATGARDLLESISTQPSRAMSFQQWDRFTGEAAARHALASIEAGQRVKIVDEGKNADVIRRVLTDRGADIIDDAVSADAVVIGTLSPGPMRDAWHRWGGRATMCA